jgi:hypothetical protein
MFNSDLTANRPAAGIVGRIFIAIDAPYGIFRDTGTSWDQVSSAGGGATLYSGDGTLSGNRTVSSGGFNLTFAPQTTFSSSLTAATGGSSYSVLGSNALNYAAGFSSSNIGNVYGANGAINSQTFLGNATFAQANLASAMVNVNKITLDSGGHTITMTQSTAPGIRAMTAVQNQIQYTGTHNGTISHAAISQNLGFFRDTGAIRTLTITNAYSLLLNPLDDYGSGFNFTNRWGIYQAGPSDTNYFAANVGIGTDAPQSALHINADIPTINGLTITRTGVTLSDANFQITNGSSTAGQFLPSFILTSNFSSGGSTIGGFFSARITNSNTQDIGLIFDARTKTATALTQGYIVSFRSFSTDYIRIAHTGNLILQNGGTFTDSGQRLQNQGATLLNGATTINGEIQIDSSFRKIFAGASRTDTSRTSTGTSTIFYNALQLTANNAAWSFYSDTIYTITSGNINGLFVRNTFAPTSGTATFSNEINPTIFQSGGASGITRGLFINPTITAAADWRAIEVSAGVSVLAPSTTASATLRVPSGTAPTTPVDGDIWFNGTNLFMRIGGVTRTFTII